MSIPLHCSSCESHYQVAESMAGKRTRCKCGAVLTIPSPAGGAEIIVQCGSCGQRHKAKPQLAGKSARCGCGAVIHIPHPSGNAPGSDLFDDLVAAESSAQPEHRPLAQPQTQNWIAQPQKPSDDEILASHMVDDSWRKPDPRDQSYSDSGSGMFSFEAGIFNSGTVGGLLAMVGGLVWFFGGLAAGYIFFYAPVLFVLGLGAFLRGIIWRE